MYKTILYLIILGLLAAADDAPAQSLSSRDSAYPNYLTGNALWLACGQTVDGNPPDACAFYVAGVSDGYSTTRLAQITSHIDPGPRTVCIPAGVSGDQLADVVRKYLSIYPEIRHDYAGLIVLSALRAAFPCPTSQ